MKHPDYRPLRHNLTTGQRAAWAGLWLALALLVGLLGLLWAATT